MNCFYRDKEECYCYCYVCRSKIHYNQVYYVLNSYRRTFLLCSRECTNIFVRKC